MLSSYEKTTKLREALKKIEFKCSNDEVMQYMIAKYISEKIKEVRQKRVETLQVNAEKICKNFNIQYNEDVENAFNELKTDFKDVRELEKYCNDLVAEFESYSKEEEIEIRTNFKDNLKQQLVDYKDELSTEIKNFIQRVIEDIDELSYQQFRDVVKLFVKYSNVA